MVILVPAVAPALHANGIVRLDEAPAGDVPLVVAFGRGEIARRLVAPAAVVDENAGLELPHQLVHVGTVDAGGDVPEEAHDLSVFRKQLRHLRLHVGDVLLHIRLIAGLKRKLV